MATHHAARAILAVLATLTSLAVGFAGCRGAMRATDTPAASMKEIARPASSAPRAGASGGPRTLRATYQTFPDSAEKRARLLLLVDNTEAWTERWRLLAEAKKTLDVTYFILHEDVFGVAFLGHLLKKAEEGVRIRLLLDGFGTTLSWSARGNDYFDELAESGNVSIRIYRPRETRFLEALLVLDPAVAISSEHDKIIVADGKSSLIGGRNIALEYFADPAEKRHVFHDTDLRIDSPSVGKALTSAFAIEYASEESVEAGGEALNLVSRRDELLSAYETMDAFLRAPPVASPKKRIAKRPAKPGTPERERTPVEVGEAWGELAELPRLRGALHEARPRAFHGETRVLDSLPRPDARTDPITEALFGLVDTARRTVLIQSPYLVLSDEGMEALAKAGRRGIAITILTNSPVSSDNALSQAFFLEQWPELLARVPHLRLFVGGREITLHDKVAVFDDTVATVGTYNLDPTSMALNGEVVAAVWSPAFARAVAAEPRRILAEGAPSVYEYRIEKDRAGKPVRNEDGTARIAFGPRDHCTPEEWTALGAYWTMLKAAKFVGLSPLL